MTEHVSLFKEAMSNYPTGVTIVTATDKEGEPVGLTVNSFASVSLDPLLVLWSIDKNVSSLDIFKRTEKFAIHILTEDQGDVCRLFASRGVDRFSECDWTLSKHDLPIIANTAAVLQCRTYEQVDAGDHIIMIGEVIELEVEEKAPLLYHRRQFGGIPTTFYR